MSGHLSDLSGSKSAVELRTRHSPAASPTRRLRFEDETETEVEFRYLERQRRRAGQQGTSVLVSKPDLKLYVKGRAGAGPQGARHIIDRQQRGQRPAGGTDQCHSCRTVLGGGFNLNLQLHPPVLEDRGRTLYRPRLNLRTEPIRETYIGSVTPGETSRRGGGGQYAANNQERRMTNQVQLHENQANLLQATSTTDLPINPYATDQRTTSIQPSYLAPPISKCPFFSSPPPSAMMSQSIRLNGTKVGKNPNQNQEELGRPAAARPHKELRSGAQLKERSPCVEEGLDLRVKNSSSSETTGDNICMCLHL